MTDDEFHDGTDSGETGELTTGRRGLLGKAAVAAVVAAATGVGVSRRAQAANNDVINVGNNETGTLTTQLSGGSTLKVIDGSSAGPTGDVKGSVYAVQSATSAAAILGEATGTGYGWAVYGKNSSSQGLGVYGKNTGTGGVGVYGEHKAGTTEAGTGVIGVSNSGTGVVGSGTSYDFRTANSGKVLLNNTAFTNPPSGASTAGTLGRDAAGNLWYSPASGVYRKLAGTGTAGAFHALTPARLYDSRVAAPAIGALATGLNRTLSMADKRNLDTGAVETANYVPVGATAIACNVTVVNTAGSGFLTVNPGGNTTVSAATINWFGANQIINNGVIVTLNASREVTVICGGSSSSADFVIDVTGYFL